MKAALIAKNGGPEVLIYGDAPDPVAGPGQVVVDIYAASVNAADWKVRVDGDGASLQFPISWGGIFPAWSAPWAMALLILPSAMRCLASATWARRAPMRKKSP